MKTIKAPKMVEVENELCFGLVIGLHESISSGITAQ